MNQDGLTVYSQSDGRQTIPKFTLGSFRVQLEDQFGAGDHFGAYIGLIFSPYRRNKRG